jgi:hypothetical protein
MGKLASPEKGVRVFEIGDVFGPEADFNRPPAQSSAASASRVKAEGVLKPSPTGLEPTKVALAESSPPPASRQ